MKKPATARSSRGKARGSDAEFERLAAVISKDPRVDAPEVARAKGFGSKGLKVARKLFAFGSKGRLIVKLSQERVDELVASGKGRRFEPRPGRIMKEWFAAAPNAKASWLPLAREALEYAVGAAKRR
jgi:hypothetical protein